MAWSWWSRAAAGAGFAITADPPRAATPRACFCTVVAAATSASEGRAAAAGAAVGAAAPPPPLANIAMGFFLPLSLAARPAAFQRALALMWRAVASAATFAACDGSTPAADAAAIAASRTAFSFAASRLSARASAAAFSSAAFRSSSTRDCLPRCTFWTLVAAALYVPIIAASSACFTASAASSASCTIRASSANRAASCAASHLSSSKRIHCDTAQEHTQRGVRAVRAWHRLLAMSVGNGSCMMGPRRQRGPRPT